MTTKIIYNWDGSKLTSVDVKETKDVMQEEIDRLPTKSETRWNLANAIECTMWCFCVVMLMGLLLSIISVNIDGWTPSNIYDVVYMMLCSIFQVLIALMCKWAKSSKTIFGTEKGLVWLLPTCILLAIWGCLLINLISSTLSGTIEFMHSMY